MNNIKTIIGLLLLLLVLILFKWFLWDRYLHPDRQEKKVVSASTCYSTKEGLYCRLSTEATVRFTPQPRPSQPFLLTVTGLTAETPPFVEFSMPDMDMGLNRYKLAKRAKGQWEGSIILPVCTTTSRLWLALFYTEKNVYHVEFKVK